MTFDCHDSGVGVLSSLLLSSVVSFLITKLNQNDITVGDGGGGGGDEGRRSISSSSSSKEEEKVTCQSVFFTV